MFHTWSWLAWLVAAAVPAFTLRNPAYLVLILGAGWIVFYALGRATPMGRSWGSFVHLGLFLFAFTIPFTALSNHLGRLVLFRLPEGWPIVGGPITCEAAIVGAVSGLSLLTILMVFAAFNAVVDHYQLLRMTPAFLFQAGVIVSIAVTFVPQMVQSAKEIREAQRIRGHRFRGVRGLLPLVLPLLANGLERAIQLAETMEARGFGSSSRPASPRQAIAAQAGTLAGLLALLAGLFIMTYRSGSGAGWALTGLGSGILVAVFFLLGRQVRRTRFQSQRWTARDSAVALASVLVLVAVIAGKAMIPQALVYSPFPPNSLLPPFAPTIGAALLLLVVPALLAPGIRHQVVGSTQDGPGSSQQTSQDMEHVP